MHFGALTTAARGRGVGTPTPKARRSLHLRSAPLAAAILCAVPSAGLAQDAAEVASVETEMEMGPQDLPGHGKAPQVKPVPASAEPAPPVPPAPPTEPTVLEREWFGGKPFLRWSRATGDWGGIRTRLEDAGITLNGSYTLDWSSVYSGGLRNVASTRSLLDLNATLNMEKIVGLAGNTFFLDFQSTDVSGGSRDVGDIQGISNIETGVNVHQLSEIWDEQKFFGDKLRVKVGKIDANKEFNALSCGGNFLHSSVGFSPNILTLPTYPDPAFGAVMYWYPCKQAYVGGGFFDGSLADGIHTGRRGPASLFDGNEYFFIGEIGLTWSEVASLGKGRIAAGGWSNTGRFATSDGGVDRSTEGAYLFFEQQLTRRGVEGDDAARGLYLFGRYAYADDDVAVVANHVAAGLSLLGTFSGRELDGAGVFVSYADLSDESLDDETAIEAFYKFAVTPFLSITPDLQVIANPGGNSDTDTAVVGTLRVQVAF